MGLFSELSKGVKAGVNRLKEVFSPHATRIAVATTLVGVAMMPDQASAASTQPSQATSVKEVGKADPHFGTGLQATLLSRGLPTHPVTIPSMVDLSNIGEKDVKEIKEVKLRIKAPVAPPIDPPVVSEINEDNHVHVPVTTLSTPKPVTPFSWDEITTDYQQDFGTSGETGESEITSLTSTSYDSDSHYIADRAETTEGETSYESETDSAGAGLALNLEQAPFENNDFPNETLDEMVNNIYENRALVLGLIGMGSTLALKMLREIALARRARRRESEIQILTMAISIEKRELGKAQRITESNQDEIDRLAGEIDHFETQLKAINDSLSIYNEIFEAPDSTLFLETDSDFNRFDINIAATLALAEESVASNDLETALEIYAECGRLAKEKREKTQTYLEITQKLHRDYQTLVQNASERLQQVAFQKIEQTLIGEIRAAHQAEPKEADGNNKVDLLFTEISHQGIAQALKEKSQEDDLQFFLREIETRRDDEGKIELDKMVSDENLNLQYRNSPERKIEPISEEDYFGNLMVELNPSEVTFKDALQELKNKREEEGKILWDKMAVEEGLDLGYRKYRSERLVEIDEDNFLEDLRANLDVTTLENSTQFSDSSTPAANIASAKNANSNKVGNDDAVNA